MIFPKHLLMLLNAECLKMAPHSKATRSPEIPNCISMHPVFEAFEAKKHFGLYVPFKNMSWVQTLRKCWSTNGLWPEGVKMNNYELTYSLKHACTGFFFFFFFSLILENRTFPDDNHEICGFVWVNSPSLPSLFFTSACSEINPCGYHPERASLSQESWKTYSYNSH